MLTNCLLPRPGPSAHLPAQHHFDTATAPAHLSTKPRLLSLTVQVQNGKIILLYLVVLIPALVALRLRIKLCF